MLPELGLLIAAYTGTRLLHLIVRNDVHIFMKLVAGFSLLVTAFLSLDFLVRGATTTIPTLPR